jgi:hypothetical protein
MDIPSGTLFVYDLLHAELLMKVFVILSGLLPFVTVILVLYFLITSFALTFFTDQLYARWGTRVGAGLLFVNFLTGGFVISSIYDFASGSDSSITSSARLGSIDTIYLAKNPGTDATVITVDSFGSLPFESFAYMSLDDTLAFESLDNLANLAATSSTNTLTKSTMTYYSITPSSVSERGKTSFYNAWLTTNDRFEKMPVLANLMIYTINTISTIGYTAQQMFGYHQVAGIVGAGGEYAGGNLSFNNWRTPAETDLYASTSSDSSSYTATTATVSTYPGGPSDYANYVMDHSMNQYTEINGRMANSSAVLEKVAVLNGDELSTSSSSGTSDSLYATGDSSIYDTESMEAAQANGYTSQVPVQVYAQTHIAEYQRQCSGDLDSTGSVNAASQGISSLFSPCRLQINEQTSLGSQYEFVDEVLGGTLSDLYDTFVTSNSALISVVGKFSDVSRYGLEVSSAKRCTYSGDSLADLQSAWNDIDPEEGTTEEVCVNTGKNILASMTAIEDKIESNNEAYADYLDAQSSFSLESGRTLALAIPSLDFGSEMFVIAEQVALENHAAIDVGGMVRQMLEVFEDTDVTVVVTQPVATSSTASEGNTWSRLDTVMAIHGYVDKSADEVVSEEAASAADAAEVAAIGAGTGIVAKFAKKLMKNLMRVVQIGMVILGSIPTMMLLGVYAVLYYMTVFGMSLGVGFHSLWAVFQLGKTFNGPSSGDEQYGGLSFFPVVQFLMVPLILGAEMTSLAVSSGSIMNFLANFMESIGKAASALLLTVGSAIATEVVDLINTGPATGVVLGQPLALITEALKPIGIMIGVGMVPALLHRLMSGQPYQPAAGPGAESLNAFSGMSQSLGQGAMTALSSGKGASQSQQGSAGDGGAGAGETSKETTTLDDSEDTLSKQTENK